MKQYFKFPKLTKWHILGIFAILAVVVGSYVFGQPTSHGVAEATLFNTLIQPLRAQYAPDKFDKNELRESRYGALRFFQEESRMRPLFDQQTIANIQKSYNSTVQIPVLDTENIVVSSPYARTCALVDSENSSAIVALTFASYGWGFTMTPATHENNDIKRQTDFDRKMKKYLIAYADALDTLAINQLETDKNQYFPAELVAYYAELAGALQVAQASKDDFYNQLDAIFQTMDFYDGVHIISSTKHMPMVRRLSNQGASNDVNDGFQFQGGQIRPWNWWPTNRVTNGAGVESTLFAVNQGSVFMANRNDHDARLKSSVGTHKLWGEEMMPIADQLMGTFYQEDCGDRSAIAGAATAGNTRSKVEGYEISTDVVVATAYNSDPANRYNPILKAEVLTT